MKEKKNLFLSFLFFSWFPGFLSDSFRRITLNEEFFVQAYSVANVSDTETETEKIPCV